MGLIPLQRKLACKQFDTEIVNAFVELAAILTERYGIR